MKSKLLKIALVTERTRSYGRAICEGVATYSQHKSDWSLELVEPDTATPSVEALKSFDGIIARVFSQKEASKILESGVPAIDIFSGIPPAGAGENRIPSIDCDHSAIAKLAARHFLMRRFHSFAFCGYDGAVFSDKRKAAFMRYLELSRHECNLYRAPRESLNRYAKGITSNEKIGFDGDIENLRKWLVKLPGHTAVFCANDIRALQVLRLCREENISVPEQLAIVGVDNDTLLCSFTTPAISSVDPNAFGVGYRAAEALDQLITTGHMPALRKVKPIGMIARLSSEIYPIDPPWLSDALTYIHRNVSKNLSASDVFEHLKLSHTIVEQTFRKVLGTTVQKEIIKSRMDEARHLLATTDLAVSEIARRAGFSSAEYFCRTFVANHAQSPGEWRKSKAVGKIG